MRARRLKHARDLESQSLVPGRIQHAAAKACGTQITGAARANIRQQASGWQVTNPKDNFLGKHDLGNNAAALSVEWVEVTNGMFDEKTRY